jgi:hypothetical protein
MKDVGEWSYDENARRVIQGNVRERQVLDEEREKASEEERSTGTGSSHIDIPCVIEVSALIGKDPLIGIRGPCLRRFGS